jgi:hypothetical protein
MLQNKESWVRNLLCEEKLGFCKVSVCQTLHQEIRSSLASFEVAAPKVMGELCKMQIVRRRSREG